MSGYIWAPVGAYILGGAKSRDLVGKFVIGVEYQDGGTGAIAQEEIRKITDGSGKKVKYGNSKYPGHPDFDPRNDFDPKKEMLKQMKQIFEKKCSPKKDLKLLDNKRVLKEIQKLLKQERKKNRD